MNYRCKCGETISTSPSPHPDGLLLVPEPVLDVAETRAEEEASLAFDLINDKSVQAYRCGRCNRLMVFVDGRGTTPIFYAREDD